MKPTKPTILAELPPGTKIGDSYGTQVSYWGEYLALVNTDAYREAYKFNPETRRQTYAVRFLLTSGRRPEKILAPARIELLGRKLHVRHPLARYEDTFFSLSLWGRFGDPLDTIEGGFSTLEFFEVPISLRELNPAQSHKLTSYLQQEKRYLDVSNWKLSAADWTKALKRTFAATQKLDWKKANDFDRALSYREPGRRDIDQEDEGLWAAIPGVFATKKDGTLKFVVDRSLPPTSVELESEWARRSRARRKRTRHP